MKPCRLVLGWLFVFMASCCGCALIDAPDDSPGEALLAEAAERNTERNAERAAERKLTASTARHAHEFDSAARKRRSRHAPNEAVSIESEYGDDWSPDDADSGNNAVAKATAFAEKHVATKKAADAARDAPKLSTKSRRESDEAADDATAAHDSAANDSAIEETKAFEGMITDARSSGGMSADEEAAFRRDLAAMPSALRPQMAAMMLAMRAKSKGDSPERKTSPNELSPRERAERASDARTTPNPSVVQSKPSLSTAKTYEEIQRVTHAGRAESMGDNPLRLADGMKVSATNNAPLQSSPARSRSDSNAPAQIDSANTNLSSRPSVDSAALQTATTATTLPTARAAAGRGDETLADEIAEGERDRSPAEWQVLLGASVRTLEDQLARLPKGDENAELEARLRMLYLIANRQEDALRPLPADAKEQQFWREWLMGTSVYLDAKTMPSDANRAAAAANRLREAVHRLGEQGSLQISNLTFCRRVTSYGVYEKFTSRDAKDDVVADKRAGPESVFQPDQEVLLYAEIHNFTSRETPTGYETILKPSYQIFEGDRRVGSVVELDESRDYCRRQRNDFFVCYHIYLPKRIDPGKYRLKLTIEDVHGKKVSESNIEFAIK